MRSAAPAFPFRLAALAVALLGFVRPDPALWIPVALIIVANGFAELAEIAATLRKERP